MRVYDRGAFIRVTIDSDDVSALADKWPGSGFNSGDRVSALFDARNGDLLDVTVNGRNIPSRIAGTGALSALLQDANNYAAKRLNRPELAR